MTRIYEHQTDALFARAFTSNPDFVSAFLLAVGGQAETRIETLATQTPHRATGHRGNIDLEVGLSDGKLLLIENKIDAPYSVTNAGDPQPARYQASVSALTGKGQRAAAVLLAPEVYLRSNKHTTAFDYQVSYEALRRAFWADDFALLDAAIDQASNHYSADPDTSTGVFFAEFEEFSRAHFTELVMKRNPNGNAVRPIGSRTIYFNAARTLRDWSQFPRPRMSLQCRDGSERSASVKIMLGGLGRRAGRTKVPDSLHAIGGYIRPAGGSLGLVIDTPKLDTQMPFGAQLPAVEEGLGAARRLANWWNRHADTLKL